MSRKDLETVEPWRSALREGDPALGAPDLDPQEVARMRRAVLAAAQEKAEKPRPLPWLSPAWGGAIVAAVLFLALGLGWLPNREEPAPERVAVHAPAPVPQAPPALPPAPAPPFAARATPEPAAPGARVPERAAPAVPPPPALAPAPEPDPPDPEPEMALAEATLAELDELDWSEVPAEPLIAAGEALPRQVQFATPGGTRVIWVLDPEDDATQEALSAGPEEKTE